MSDCGRPLRELTIIIKGAGEQATGIACRLHRAHLARILMLETPSPLAVRRLVAFCEAVHDRSATVEEIEAVRIADDDDLSATWGTGRIAVLVDPEGKSIARLRPDVVIDATLAKRNLGTSVSDAPLVVALGPGFTAGRDCHVVVETNRGHDLGRLITAGTAAANTGIPGDIGGYTRERVVRAPAAGLFSAAREIGAPVRQGEAIGRIGPVEVTAGLTGVLRGLIRPGATVRAGQKIGDVDPRGDAGYCFTVSEKARALGGAVLEAILTAYNV